MRALLTVMLIVAPLALARPAQAGTRIVVDSLADNLVTDGKCTLREALVAANNDVPIDTCPAGNGADEVVLPPGEIQLALRGTNPYPDGLPYVISSDLTLTGAGKSATRIRHVDGYNGPPGELLPGADILVITPTTQAPISVAVRDLSFESVTKVLVIGISSYRTTNLIVERVAFSRLYYGIQHRSPGNLTVLDSNFYSASGRFSIFSNGSLLVRRSTFSGSRKIYNVAIEIDQIYQPEITAFIADSKFSYMGTILQTDVKATLQRVTAEDIVGGTNVFIAARGLTIEHSLFQRIAVEGYDTKTGYIRPACMIISRGEISIHDTAFVDFEASSRLPGWPPVDSFTRLASLCVSEGTLLITDSTFANHRHALGRLLSLNNMISATIQNTTIFNTDAPITTSVIYNDSPTSTIAIVNTTIASTTVPVFAHAGPPANFVVANTAISSTAGCGVLTGLNKITSAGHNLTTDGSCFASTQPTDLITSTTGLGPLTRLSDKTYVLPLEADSPAIDAGPPVSAALTTDQRGMPRSFGGSRTDIGAYERIDMTALKRVWLPISAR